MTKQKHTPGPWRINGVSLNSGSIMVGNDKLRLVIADVHNGASIGDMISAAMKRGGGKLDPGDAHTQFANARLIAAAPDLLEAAHDNLAALECIRNYLTKHASKLPPFTMATVDKRIEATRAAIARTEAAATHAENVLASGIGESAVDA